MDNNLNPTPILGSSPNSNPMPNPVPDPNSNPNPMSHKEKMGLIFGLLMGFVVLSVLIVFVVNLTTPSRGNGEKNGETANVPAAPQEFLNEGGAGDDTLSVIFRNDYNNVFFGFKADDVSKDLKLESFGAVSNQYGTRVREYMGGHLNIDTPNHDYFFSLNEYKYEANAINTDEIVYEKDGYYVTYDDFLKDYDVLYKYGESGDEWLLISLDSLKDKESAISRVDDFLPSITICVFDDEINETNCPNYKKYNNLNDFVVRELDKVGIHVRSYKNVVGVGFSETMICDESVGIRYDLGTIIPGSPLDSGGYESFEMDGETYYYMGYSNYFGYGEIARQIGDTIVGYSFHLDNDNDRSFDHVRDLFVKTFGK